MNAIRNIQNMKAIRAERRALDAGFARLDSHDVLYCTPQYAAWIQRNNDWNRKFGPAVDAVDLSCTIS